MKAKKAKKKEKDDDKDKDKGKDDSKDVEKERDDKVSGLAFHFTVGETRICCLMVPFLPPLRKLHVR